MGQAPTVHAPISCCILLTVMLTWQTLRKLILIAGLVFVYPGTTTQVWVSLLIACLFLGLTTYHMPCVSPPFATVLHKHSLSVAPCL